MAKTQLTRDIVAALHAWHPTSYGGYRADSFRQGFDALEVPVECGSVKSGLVDFVRVQECFTAEIKISVSDFHSAHGHNFVGHCNYYAMPTELYKKVKGEIPEDIGVLLYYDGESTCGIRKAKECKPQILSESTQKWLILSVAKRLPRFDKN